MVGLSFALKVVKFGRQKTRADDGYAMFALYVEAQTKPGGLMPWKTLVLLSRLSLTHTVGVTDQYTNTAHSLPILPYQTHTNSLSLSQLLSFFYSLFCLFVYTFSRISQHIFHESKHVKVSYRRARNAIRTIQSEILSYKTTCKYRRRTFRHWIHIFLNCFSFLWDIYLTDSHFLHFFKRKYLVLLIVI